MISIWLYLFGILGGLIGGFLILGFIYWLINKIMNRAGVEGKLPKDKKQISEFIKNNKEFFMDGGKESINEKEEEHNERRKFARTREFEKLRRNTEFKEPVGTSPRNDYTVPTNADIQGRREFPILPPRNVSRNDTGNKKLKRKFELI